MRKLTMAACAVGLAIALGTGMASAAQASSVIVVGPGHSIQAAINAARPGDTVFVRPGVYHQSVQIRKNGITLRGSGAFHGGTVLVPPKHFPKTLCNEGFGPTGVCILAKRVDPKTGAVFTPVRNDTVTGLLVTGFPGNGVFGYGTVGLKVTRVVASTTAVTASPASSPRRPCSPTTPRSVTTRPGSMSGIRRMPTRWCGMTGRSATSSASSSGTPGTSWSAGNVVSGNCQGILVLDDGQRGGAGNAIIRHNRVFDNNKFCKKNEDTPVTTKGGGILLLGATHTQVTHNSVTGNAGRKFNSGGIVVLSAKPLTHGSNPEFDTISFNFAFRNHPADLIWDHTGIGVRFRHNHCGTSIPGGLCH